MDTPRDAAPSGGSVFYRPQRRSKTADGLSRERIVEACVALLDREGAAALTMRKVAAELDVHATSLYWHVERREDLVDLAVDAIFAGAAVAPAPHGPWTEAVRSAATAMYTALAAHPWAASFAGSRPLVGPNALELSRRILRGLESTGADVRQRAVAATAISNLVLGAAVTAASARALGLDRDTALTREVVAAATGAGVPSLPVLEWQPRFEDALAVLLEGVAARLGR
ncbi:TetR/AcrR family transcriptional regulator C-terminal domain-containing protein [Diaminobutyricimonas aerilata]|uniref:TetR/AcrR family transcriptional regulator C-terminal domain-containing protein n=1 Tax=Diaminobutyricimonas aerilata TaxID=1162967 RepID=UPI001B804780|nr:TetR/AcrR family transcriptional regulator C-terminal domain-containing protein [Diaminobutyricimonas aerilata]